MGCVWDVWMYLGVYFSKKNTISTAKILLTYPLMKFCHFLQPITGHAKHLFPRILWTLTCHAWILELQTDVYLDISHVYLSKFPLVKVCQILQPITGHANDLLSRRLWTLTCHASFDSAWEKLHKTWISRPSSGKITIDIRNCITGTLIRCCVKYEVNTKILSHWNIQVCVCGLIFGHEYTIHSLYARMNTICHHIRGGITTLLATW